MHAKHTPGPWKCSWNGRWLIQTKGGWLIARLAPPKARGNFSPENVEANAKLIAAAPDLLNALELAQATIERLDRHAPGAQVGTLAVIRNAINQATA